MAHRWTLKYVWWSGTGREQLFDLAADPQECRDLYASPETARWRNHLVATLVGREEGFVADGRLVTGRPVRPLLSATQSGPA